jgi:hypothetical protein
MTSVEFRKVTLLHIIERYSNVFGLLLDALAREPGRDPSPLAVFMTCCRVIRSQAMQVRPRWFSEIDVGVATGRDWSALARLCDHVHRYTGTDVRLSGELLLTHDVVEFLNTCVVRECIPNVDLLTFSSRDSLLAFDDTCLKSAACRKVKGIKLDACGLQHKFYPCLALICGTWFGNARFCDIYLPPRGLDGLQFVVGEQLGGFEVLRCQDGQLFFRAVQPQVRCLIWDDCNGLSCRALCRHFPNVVVLGLSLNNMCTTVHSAFSLSRLTGCRTLHVWDFNECHDDVRLQCPPQLGTLVVSGSRPHLVPIRPCGAIELVLLELVFCCDTLPTWNSLLPNLAHIGVYCRDDGFTMIQGCISGSTQRLVPCLVDVSPDLVAAGAATNGQAATSDPADDDDVVDVPP